MKFSDDEYDKKSNKMLAVILGIFCGIAIAYLASNNIDAAYIFLGILIATGISFKIDGIHHIATLLVFLFLFTIWGINTNILSNFSLITLFICIFSAFIDEIGNDNPVIYKKSRFLRIFFDYRFSMKTAILFLALLGLYQGGTGFTLPFVYFLSFQTFIFFMLFELFYELAGFAFDKYIL